MANITDFLSELGRRNIITMKVNHSRKLGGRLAWIIWLLATFFSIYKFVSQTSYASLNAGIAKELMLDLGQIGELGAIYTYAFAVMTIPSGALLDRYGARKILTVAAGIVALGAFIFSTAVTWFTLVLGQILMGLGGAFGFPGAGYLTRHWFRITHFGVMFGLVQSCVTMSSGLVQGNLGYLAEQFDWREIMFCGAIIGVVLMAGMAVVIRDPQEVLEKSRTNAVSFWKGFYLSLKEVLVNKDVWVAAIPGAMAFAVLLSTSVLWGIKLLSARGFDEVTASMINAVIWIGFAFGAPVIALISIKLRSFKLPFGVCLLAQLLNLIILLFAPVLTTGVAYSLFFLTGFFGGVSMLSFTVTTKVCRDIVSGTAIAVVNMVMFLLSGLMMSIPAKFMNEIELTIDSLNGGLLFLPAGLMIAFVFVLCMRETYGNST